jgi:hypothetical protein
MYIMFPILGILNALDGGLTYIGIHLGFIEELNPLMSWLWDQSSPLFLLLKLAFSFLVVILPLILTSNQIKRISYLLIPACILYFGILIVHIHWIISYFEG